MTELTREQKEAVFHSEGSACVIAGAGTGKTTTLAERISHLVNSCNIEPSRIIVTTFTRKATAELYDRTFRLLNKTAYQLKISTIDSLVLDFARQAMDQGLIRTARLISEPQQRVLLLYSSWELFGKEYPQYAWTENIGKAKIVDLLQKCICAESENTEQRDNILSCVEQQLSGLKDKKFRQFTIFWIPTLEELKQIAEKYYEKLKELGAIDSDLLTAEFLRCLKSNEKFTEELASQADAILVDEFQDTNRIQAEILLLLSGKHRNIWVVGDQCQQIYEWRGAGKDNLDWFINKTKAKTYHLTENWRSTQRILDVCYDFLSSQVPDLKTAEMLKRLNSMRDKRDQVSSLDQRHPVYTGTLKKGLSLICQLLKYNPDIKPSDIAILSSALDKQTVESIESSATKVGLKVQFHSSRADRAMESTIGQPPHFWKAGKVLEQFYNDPRIKTTISLSLNTSDFSHLRTIRPIAIVAETLDSTLPLDTFSFADAWNVLKKTQEREIFVSNAVSANPDSIQVMTIHAAKGLEFPIVLLMKLGKSFPNLKDSESCRLAYVGGTRAKDILILIHTEEKPTQTLDAFGKDPVSIQRDRIVTNQKVEVPKINHSMPVIGASNLDLYEQCPLKFAAYHEGRYLPNWSISQSVGSRMHKALEYYLRAGMPTDESSINDCFDRGYRNGDSPIRILKEEKVAEMKQNYQKVVQLISKTTKKVIAVEQKYRYFRAQEGQIDGAVDAIVERRDGAIVLKEWKTIKEIKSSNQQKYTLQAGSGALGIIAQQTHPPIQLIEIVPVLNPTDTISLSVDSAFVDKINKELDEVFQSLQNKNYEPHKSEDNCKSCELKRYCPAWQKKVKKKPALSDYLISINRRTIHKKRVQL
ncbi:MAG: ATP-dependent DNA helicase [Deltaproteobacteria bacterium]